MPLFAAAEVALGRQRAPQYEFGKNLVPYLRSANIVDGALDLTDVKSMNFTPAEQNIFSLRYGDVLMTEGSGSRDSVGASAVWGAELAGPVCFQNTLLRLRPRKEVSDGRFLYWWARHAHASGEIAAVASGANIKHIGAGSLRRLPVLLPPLDEQRRIAAFLDDQVARIDKAIALRERQIAIVELRRSAVLEQRVLGSQNDDRIGAAWEPFGEVPSHWKQGQLRSVECDVQTGPFGTQLHSDEYVTDGWPVVNPAGISPNGLTAVPGMAIDTRTRARLREHILRRSDVVFGRRGELGRAGLVDVEQEGWVCGTGSLRVRIAGYDLNPAYLLRLLRTTALRYYFDTQAVGSTMANLNTGILMAMPILLPPRAEQDQIVEQATMAEAAHRELTIATTSQVLLLQERKRSLITAAVTGEFDVSSASTRALAGAAS